MKVLLTGGSGFIGRTLAEGLARKHEILAPSHSELELLDEKAVSDYIKGNSVEAIVHCANRGGTRDSVGTQRVVEDNLRIFFNLARNADSVEKMVYFGSGAEYAKDRDLKKVDEAQFGEKVPKDDYGFYKYVCARYAEKSENIVNLRLFGIFGKYENYHYKFISNAVVKNLLGMGITINQDVVFDFLYAEDLAPVVQHFITHDCAHRSYNVTPSNSISLMEIAKTVNQLSKKESKISVINKGLNFEYTGSNARLVEECPAIRFTSCKDSIKELMGYFGKELKAGRIDEAAIRGDTYLSRCRAKKGGKS